MTLTANNKKLRAGLHNSLPEVDHAAGDPERDPEFTYVPPSHARALDPNTSIVEGIRGAGKSFWWSHLSSEPHKKFVSEAFPEAKINPRVDALKAFGAQSNSADAPSVDVLADLMRTFPPRTIWRAVCAHKIGIKNNLPATSSWKARVNWVFQNPEAFDAEIVRIDNQLEAQNKTRVILFDALDRLADDWQGIRPLAKGLLQVAQDLRSTRRIRFKIFVRPDMLQDKEIVGFPDASKLLARKAQLAWRRADLYALLFQCLGNDSSAGAIFRKLTTEALDCDWIRDRKAWVLPPELRSDEKVQEAAFVMLAGRAMASGASGHKRGRPYTWLVNHLQDGLDQVSPRSFFSAIREAATQTRDDNAYALGYKEIQLGVQSASQIRVNEIAYEDYPWVDLVMKPLRGKLSVPCAVDYIAAIWRKEKTLGILSGQLKAAGSSAVKLPPQSLEEGSLGVLKDLEALGIVKQLNDKRIQMPDVYRIAFGLGRRGGVKPLK